MTSTKDKKKKRRRRRVRAPPQENVRASNLTRATPTNILLEQQALGRLIKNVSTAGLDYSQPVYDEYVRNIHQRSIAQRYNRPDVNEILGVRARQLVRNLVRPHGHAPARERSQRVGREPSGSPFSEADIRDRNVFERVDDKVREARERGEIESLDASPIKQERDIQLQEDLGQVADRAVQGLEGIDQQLAVLQGDVGGMEANLTIPEVSAISGPPQAEEPPQEESLISTGKESAFERYVTPEAQIRRPQNPVASLWDDDVAQASFQAEDDYDPYEEAKSDDTPIPEPSYMDDYDTDTEGQLNFNYDDYDFDTEEKSDDIPITPSFLDQIRAEVGGEIRQPIQYEKTETRYPRLAAQVDPSNIINTPENQIRTLRSRGGPITSTPALDLADMLGIGSGDGGRTATRAQVEELMREM